MAQQRGGKQRQNGKSRQNLQRGRRNVAQRKQKTEVKWNWPVIWLLIGVAVLAAAVISVSVNSVQQWRSQAGQRHVDDIITRAGALEPHFWQTEDIYYNDPEQTAELLARFGTTSLGPWSGFWGVVLDDGTVVLGLYKGEITYKSGVPVLAEVESDGHDAMILEGLNLPEAWRGCKITITRENNTALTHFVAVARPEGSYADGAPSDYYAAMWVWTGDCYEFGLDAVPDEVYDPSERDDAPDDASRNGLLMSTTV